MPNPMPTAPSSRPCRTVVDDRKRFFVGGDAVGSLVAREKIASIVHDGHARGNVSGAGAEIDQRFSFPALVKLGDRPDANFQFQRGSDAVVGFVMIVLVVLTVRVKIDEAGSDHQAAHVHDGASYERSRRDCFNAFAADADVTNRIQAGFRIHDTAVGENRVVGLGAQVKIAKRRRTRKFTVVFFMRLFRQREGQHGLAGGDRDILAAVESVADGRRDDGSTGLKPPEHFAGASRRTRSGSPRRRP